MTTTMQNGTAIADDLLQRIGKTVGDKAQVSAVFGEPVQAERITVIPVGKARFAFGGGGAGQREGNEGSGGGGGGAVVVSPIGYIELREGSARFRRIPRPANFFAAIATGSLLALTVTRLQRVRPRATRKHRASFSRASRSRHWQPRTRHSRRSWKPALHRH
jgi:uncharacterized spore protein YtfJ